MLGVIRSFLGTRAARLFFVVLIVPFVLWGVADVVRNMGGDRALATVDGRRIEFAEFDAFYRQVLNAQPPGSPALTPERRRLIGDAVMRQLVAQQAMAGEVAKLGIVVPDTDVRQAVFGGAQFRGLNGAYNPALLANYLQRTHQTQAQLVEEVRTSIGQQRLLEVVQSGASAPEVLVRQSFAFEHEMRSAEVVTLPLASAPDPEAPTDAELHDAYANDPRRYAVPAFRTVRFVVLSAETAARRVEVPDADIAAYYDQHKSIYDVPEKRAADVIVAQDEAAAQRLADQWKAGAAWDDVHAAAEAAGATATHLDDTEQSAMASPDLGEAIFGTAADTVAGPAKGVFGWQVLRVTHVAPGTVRPLAEVTDEIRALIAHERAVDELPMLAKRLEDSIAAGNGVDQIDAESGAEVLGGTLDANGITPAGEPAPLPGSAALRPVLIKAAFATPLGEPLQATNGPQGSVFALTVTAETAPEVKPFDAAAEQVRENWLRDARRRAVDVVASGLVAAMRTGSSMEDAATVAGVAMEHLPPVARASRTDGVPEEFRSLLFSMKVGDVRVEESADAFIVIRLASVASPDPGTDAAGLALLRTRTTAELGQNTAAMFNVAVFDQAAPKINRPALDAVMK